MNEGDFEVKNVLLIVNSFPPTSSVDSLRWCKFVKYMAENGWQPSVLTRRVSSDEHWYDNDLLNDLPENMKIIRIRAIDLMDLHDRLRRYAWFFKYEGRWFSNCPKSFLLRICDSLISKALFCFLDFFKRFLLVFPPDSKVGWIPFLYIASRQILTREKIDVIFTYGTPHSNSMHLAGYCIKKKFKRPWIVGYDDEWSQHPWRSPVFKWQRRLDRRLERKVIYAADRVIATTPSYRALYARLLPQQFAKKFHTVTYSYDESDFQHEQGIPSKNFMHFAYVGSLYQRQTPFFFLKALKQLIVAKLVTIEKVRLTFAGMVAPDIRPLLQDDMLRSIISWSGICSHRAAIKSINNADILILIVSSARGNGNIPAKTFEYIGSGKPILALVPEDGDAAEIIKDTGTGIVVPPEDIEAIKDAISRFYTQWELEGLKISPDWNKIKYYESGRVAKRLCDIMSEAIADYPKKERKRYLS